MEKLDAVVIGAGVVGLAVARGRWAKVGSPAGELDVLKPPVNIDGMEPRMDAIPAVGEHTATILTELGYDAAEIGRLAAAGAI